MARSEYKALKEEVPEKPKLCPILERDAANSMIRWWRLWKARPSGIFSEVSFEEPDSYWTSFDGSSIVESIRIVETLCVDNGSPYHSASFGQATSVHISETDSGVELVPRTASATITQHTVCCGFEAFYPT
jgi:hypothetical protein